MITIGASDVPVILGFSPWQTPSAVWARLKGLTSGNVENNATRRGHTLELGVIMEYAEERGLLVYDWATAQFHLKPDCVPPYRVGLYRGPSIKQDRILHPVHEWAGCRPDAIVLNEDGSRYLVEVKTTRSFRDWNGEDGSPIVPPHYMLQVQWQMFVTGTKLTHLEAFCTYDDDRRTYQVDYNPAVADRVFSLVSAWYQRHILGDELPDNITAEVAGLVWPKPVEPETWLEPSDDDLVVGANYAKLSSQIKQASVSRDACKDKLIARIKDATGIVGVASWRLTSRGRAFRCLIEGGEP